jgi:hypothetical protein
MASRILDAGALPHAVLDSCHKPTQRRGGLNGPSGNVSRRGCAGAPKEGMAAVIVDDGMGAVWAAWRDARGGFIGEWVKAREDGMSG